MPTQDEVLGLALRTVQVLFCGEVLGTWLQLAKDARWLAGDIQ